MSEEFGEFIFSVIDAYASAASGRGPIAARAEAVEYISREMEEGLYSNPLSTRDFLLRFMIGFDRSKELARRSPHLREKDVLSSDGSLPSYSVGKGGGKESEIEDDDNESYSSDASSGHEAQCSVLPWETIRNWRVKGAECGCGARPDERAGFDLSCLERNPHIIISSSHPEDESYWRGFSSHLAVTMGAVLRYRDKPWDWEKLSRNPSISEEDKASHPDLPWVPGASPEEIPSINPLRNILFDEVLGDIEKGWDWKLISTCTFPRQMKLIKKEKEEQKRRERELGYVGAFIYRY